MDFDTATLYFEFDTGTDTRIGIGTHETLILLVYSTLASRIWAESIDGAVEYIKYNGYKGEDLSTLHVDLDEFFWIKLKGVPLSSLRAALDLIRY